MMRLGSYYAKAGRYEESMSQLQSALTIFNNTLATSYHTSDCKMNRVHFPLLSPSAVICAGHYFLAFTFLKLKDVTQALHHVEQCLLLRNIIFPDGHQNIVTGRQNWIDSQKLSSLLSVVAENLKEDIEQLEKHTVA